MNPTAQVETARPELAQNLFGKGDTQVFAVLDGASAPGLVKHFYKHEPEYCCLYRGELQPDIATVAPYLAQLEAGSEFAKLVLRDGWGAHWGIFLVSQANLRALRDHFRQFHTVQLPDQRTVLFRYYDPRVLRSFLPACNADELREFFGPVQAFILEAETAQDGVKFALAGSALRLEPFRLPKPA